ncbi:hypothetical protein H310_14494 [Aphanomyces invadans]|uniref:Myb/SANT-like domain-containing protein n=1 Tax=Aphanomyces invadans TaxID=157072 RepID=A0A024TAW4_9STRA|nr:hypothetical protein H310_14494 [Aphanomyces invadans]ETV90756.1 hypothetical protein H310_14494 [Aphanomyces invadans]|eukprot:XP_008880592.1 hypothetical protein H310_14494 [Aphanomyces invadans]
MVLWTHELDCVWLEELLHQSVMFGKRARSGYKKEAWVSALQKINADRVLPFKMSQLKSRHDAIKSMYGVISRIVNTSGMGWEATTCRVLCNETTWDHFLAGKPPSFAIWKDRPFPQYDLCQQLFEGTLATGRFASTSTTVTPFAPPQTSSASDDDGQDNDDQGNDVDLDGSVHSDATVQEPNSGQRKRRQAAPQNDSGGSKRRHRASAASGMTEQFKAQNEIAPKELELYSQVLATTKTNETEAVPALDILQDEFEHVLSLENMVTAVEILESSDRSRTFVHLKGRVREAWLQRQIERAQSNQF